MSENNPRSPIAIFDSGIGGLSVLREVCKFLPQENLLFLADQAHVPYGPRPLEEIRAFSGAIVEYFLSRNAKLIVIACNAASAASLISLRENYPQVSFVGMEPALKPAVEHTASGAVGVLATPATFQGRLYQSVVERFAVDVKVIQNTCVGLVQQIEQGNLLGGETQRILEEALAPMASAGVDTVVLGCTHYPFVIPQIQQIVGQAVRVIDPSPAVARQIQRLLAQQNLLNPQQQAGEVEYLTSGNVKIFEKSLYTLLGIQAQARQVCHHEGRVSTDC